MPIQIVNGPEKISRLIVTLHPEYIPINPIKKNTQGNPNNNLHAVKIPFEIIFSLEIKIEEEAREVERSLIKFYIIPSIIFPTQRSRCHARKCEFPSMSFSSLFLFNNKNEWKKKKLLLDHEKVFMIHWSAGIYRLPPLLMNITWTRWVNKHILKIISETSRKEWTRCEIHVNGQFFMYSLRPGSGNKYNVLIVLNILNEFSNILEFGERNIFIIFWLLK